MRKQLKTTILLMVMLIGVVGIISGCSASTEASQTQEEEKYTPVEVQKAAIEAIENKMNMNGKVVANEEIAVIPKAVGIVTGVNVKLGDFVEAGSTLFIIEQADVLRNIDQAANAIEIASKGVEQAANAVDLASKGVEQAENGIKSANINYELNKEKIENAQLNLERTRQLYEAGAVPKSQLEQAELAASEKNLEALRGQIRQAEISHGQSLNQLKQAEISYKQALNQLRQAEISYEQASSGLNNTVVTAPMSGIISALNIKEGQIATNSQAAVTIVEMDQVYIQINVVESIVNRLHVGQQVEATVSAAFDEYMNSTISYISPTADPRSQLYPVKVYINNSDKKIRPGMNGQIRLGLDTVESAIVVKANAVLDKDGQKVVYVVEDNIAVEKIVTTGLDTGDYVEIKEGISEGERVIVEGQHYVENGKTVKVVRGE